jgi:hypothetical protein
MMKMLKKVLGSPLKMLDNKYIAGSVKIFLILYASMIAPKLPMFIAKLLKNPIIKICVLFLIVYTGVRDPMMSLLIAVGFTISMMTLNKLETVGSLNELIDGAVDVPQSLLNDVVDGAQDLVEQAGQKIGGPIPQVIGVANKIVDTVQGLTNGIIDGTQKVASKIVSGAEDVVKGAVGVVKEVVLEDFSMEDRTISDVQVPDMGSLNGLSGYSADTTMEASV